MAKIVSLELYPDGSGVYVYDAALNFSHLNHAAEHILTQGFSGHPRSYKLFTLGECQNLEVTVLQPDIDSSSSEIVLRQDTVRALVVPFSVSDSQSGIFISHIMRLVEVHCWLRGNTEYALVFEIKLRDDASYLSSAEYQQDIDGGFTQECCYLTFYPVETPVQPAILRADTWDTYPTFNRYTPVELNVSLQLDDSPTGLSE
jgi:hypothetical protein